MPSEVTLDFEPGNLVVIHSDGGCESRNGAGEEYGLDRVQHLISPRRSRRPHRRRQRDAIAGDLAQLRGGPQDDDATIIVVRVL